MAKKMVRSKITHKTPGLTKGKIYPAHEFGFYQGPWIRITNDRGEDISINDAFTYLEMVEKK